MESVQSTVLRTQRDEQHLSVNCPSSHGLADYKKFMRVVDQMISYYNIATFKKVVEVNIFPFI